MIRIKKKAMARRVLVDFLRDGAAQEKVSFSKK
jgi:hypothetical protein